MNAARPVRIDAGFCMLAKVLAVLMLQVCVPAARNEDVSLCYKAARWPVVQSRIAYFLALLQAPLTPHPSRRQRGPLTATCSS